MNRTELEIKLNQDRGWLLETFAAISEADLQRPLTPSQHNPEAQWSAKDHFAHLIGIEVAFTRIFKRHLEGEAHPISILIGQDGTRLPREEVMAIVHANNEDWVNKHHDKSLDELVALGQQVRADTLALIASLTDQQLNTKIPDAPWGDGTISGIMAINGDHARRHYSQVQAALTNQD